MDQYDDRRAFNALDDVLLCRVANIWKPCESSRNSIMKNWETIASTLRENQGFIAGKGGSAIKMRFEKIMKLFVSQDLASLIKSGTQAKYQERELLLEDIRQRTTDFVELADVQRAREKEKQAGIEASGLVARRLAMQAVDTIPGNTGSGGNSSVSNDEGAAASNYSQELFASASVSEVAPKATTTPTKTSHSKRARAPSSKKKITKREKLNSVMDTITKNIDSISADSDSNSALSEYLGERARLDQEESKSHRTADLKRDEAAFQREERRHQMDKERKDRQQQFMLKVMEMMTKK